MLTRPRDLDAQALCFVSKEAVEVGYACSVCLAIFSEAKRPRGECPACGSRFLQAAGQIPKKRPKKAAANGAAKVAA